MYEEGKYSEVICELDKALAINENLILGYYFLGLAYGAKDDCDQAYYATEENAKEHLGEKMYMILPKDSQKYVECSKAA